MKKKRLQALFLATIMVLSMIMNLLPAYAVAPNQDSGLCPHHTQHIGCSYQEESSGSNCNHVHNDGCGYQKAKAEVPCDKGCVDTNNDGEIDHIKGCAYQPEVIGQECTHTHNADCGYAEPTEPVPCDYVCSICDCICTALCSDGAVNENCPVCAEAYASCTFTKVDVSLTFDADYAQYGENCGANLIVAGQIKGKKVTEAQVSVSLNNEEVAMLDISNTTDVYLNGNELTFTLTNNENSGEITFSRSIPVQADSLSTLDITEEDISVSVYPEEYQNSSMVTATTMGDKLTLVEKLPTDTEYGSGTAYSTKAEDIVVRYVDSNGASAPRQEKAPDFTIYYQIAGELPAVLKESSLPFGLDSIPEITTEAGEDTWVGRVADSSSLPSTVLILENGAYVEKDIIWFLEPSYPDDYYQNAGMLVEITDDNAADYPSGLGKGWYFIGGLEPFPDDVVTIEEYVTSLNHDVYWADNADAEAIRPSTLEGLYELQFALDGSSKYQTLTKENMGQLGMESIPHPTESTQNGVWKVNWSNSLPSKVNYSDITGSGVSVTRDVNWRIVFNSAPERYAMVEVTPENADDYSSVDNQYGTYYVLETSLTFNARIYQGNADYDIKYIREAFLNQFYLDASYTGNKHQYFQLASVRDDGHYKPEENSDDQNLIAVTITNLWRYNLDNTRINYSIRKGKSYDDVDHQLTGVPGLDDGDYFSVSYDNSAVPSFSSEVNAMYSGGILKLTLTGKMEYRATKVWLDDGKTQRPTVTMELWRYRSGQSYTTASLVRDSNGKNFILDLGNLTPNPDGTYNIEFTDNLPKYDPEGYRYRYVVREYMSGDNANLYEQVFGVVNQDGSVTDTLPEYSPRDANDTFLYNGGTLSNRLKGTVPVSVTKDWKAASFQSEFDDVMVELRLQSRLKDQNAEWENTEYTYQMFGFLAENLTVTHTGNYPQYDEFGRELEYRWVEEAVWQGGKVENGIYTGGHKVPSDLTVDDSRTFVLQQNGRDIIYSSGCNWTDNSEDKNCTVITNSISNVIDYDLKKEFIPEWNIDEYADSYTFSLFRATSGSELERYATFIIDKDTENELAEIIKHVNDNAKLSIEQVEEWHVIIHGLPEFDADGQQYEYLLMESDGSPAEITTERDDKGNYNSIVTNGPGLGNIILVRKEWIDESDSQHRLPVEITVYDRATNQKIGTPVILGTNTWYALVSIGDRDYDEVYVLETKVGDIEIENPMSASGQPIPPVYTYNVTGTAVRFSTQYHDYETTYSYDEDFGATGGSGAYEGMHCYTVTNRRLGNINLTVTKKWIDGDGEKRAALQKALETAGLNLAVKLEFMSEPSLGMEQIYEITDTGFMQDDIGDIVTISSGNATLIEDNEGKNVDSVQLLNLTQSEQILYFWHLPKYDGNGASVRYTVKEIFVDQDGKEVTDLTAPKYSDVLEAWREYNATTAQGPYVVGKNHALDTQDFTLTNKLDDTTDVSWYTLWLDDFAYKEGSRPDIYLNIYAETHKQDGSVQTKLVIRNYRWEFEEYEDSPEITQEIFWKCTIENLPKYDDFGYKINYFAIMNSVVSTGDFDYLPTSYAPGEATNSDNVFADSDGLCGDEKYKDLITNVSEDPDSANYALMSGNTFVNTIYDTVTFSGEKLWSNLPDEYPLVDLPTVTFTLSRSTADGTEESGIATMTISGSDWQKLNLNGHYVFVFGYTGKNNPTSTFDEEDAAHSGKTLLSRFDNKGHLYTYSMTEKVNWEGTDAGNAGQTDGIFNSSLAGQMFNNNYTKSGTAQLSAKKYLSVPAGRSVYPAIKYELTRSYITNSSELSKPETVTTVTWMADDVKAAVDEKAQSVSSGDIVTVEYTFNFDKLPVYAPNGSKYIYTITEDKSQLGGFTTWAAEVELTANDIKADSNISDSVTNLTADDDSDIDATFLNEPIIDPSPINLTGNKVWKDLNDDLRPDVTKGLTVTLERKANAQTGQTNSIDWQEVDIENKIIWEQDPQNADRWIYTITELERYAPNGMPWIYRITEKPVQYYTASNKGVAGQKSQDKVSGDIVMYDLTNSIVTSTYFKKTWVDSNGTPITENLLGDDIELEVKYELQVRDKIQTDSTAWNDWQSADDYFKNYNELKDRTYNGVIRAALGDSKWNSDNSFNNLPRYIMDSENNVHALDYRVVETEVNVYRIGQAQPLLSQTYKVPLDNGNNAYKYTVSGDTSLFAPYYGAGKDNQANSTTNHKNQIQTTGITVAKQWVDNNNRAYETRPGSAVTRYDWEVTLIVQCSTDGGQHWNPNPVETVTLYGYDTENEKSINVDGLPRFVFDENGKLQTCTYRIRELQSEEATADGAERQTLEDGDTFNGSYTVSYSPNGLTAINTLDVTEFSAQKVWNDEEQIHQNIKFELKYLKAGGNPDNAADYESFSPAAEVQLGSGMAELNPGEQLFYAQEDWVAVWKNVPRRILNSELDKVTGNTIYKVFETPISNYITESATIGNTTTITNTQSITPSVTKHWLGVTAEDNVTVTLYRNTAEDTTAQEISTVVLTENNNWTHTFNPQPKYDSKGNAYKYWVEETQIDGQNAADAAAAGGYTISYGGDVQKGFHVYNHKIDTVYVIKDWADISDSENRPDDLKLTLQRTDKVNPSESDWQTLNDVSYTWTKDGDQWRTSFTDLPQYDIESGRAYTYRVVEDIPSGYVQEILSSDSNTFHFKNTRSELIDIPVQKVWIDNNDKLGYRPDAVTVELYSNGQPTGKTLELKPNALHEFLNFITKSSSGWDGVFEDLPKYDNTGTLIDYTVVETPVPEHYRVSYGKEQDGTQVITNTANGNLIITKNVTGNGNLSENFHFTVKLSDENINGTYGEMTFQNGIAKFMLSHGQSITASDLPADISYTVIEEEANQGAYITQIQGETGTIISGDTVQAVFTNDLSLISIPVTKSWQDNNDQDGIRPDEITVMLFADGVDTGKTLTLNEDNNWSSTFTDLNEYKSGQRIVYTVEEVPVYGYETVISGDEQSGFTITNSHTPETINISGNKTWDDKENQDGKRPDSITIRLYANGEEVQNRTVTSDSDWTWNFENLPKYKDGEEIKYTISEDVVTDYSALYDGYNVTNSYTPGKTSVTVIKNWQDNNNKDGKRPDDIVVILLANGEETGSTLVLNEENNWMGSFTNLDEYKAGEKIVYTVEEVTVDGYESVISGDAKNGFIITNSYVPDTVISQPDNSPQTGDETNITLCFMICCVGVFVIIVTLLAFKRTKHRL